VVEGGTDPVTGKRRQLRESAATYADAKRLLTKLQRQVDEDQQPKSAITVRQAHAVARRRRARGHHSRAATTT